MKYHSIVLTNLVSLSVGPQSERERAVFPLNPVSLCSPLPALLPWGFFSPRQLTDYSSSSYVAQIFRIAWR